MRDWLNVLENFEFPEPLKLGIELEAQKFSQ